MEGTFPRNVHLRILFKKPSPLRAINQVGNDWNSEGNPTTGYQELRNNSNSHEKPEISVTKVINIIKCRTIQNSDRFYQFIVRGSFFIIIFLYFDYISMLKRSHSMEFDSEQFKTSINPHLPSDLKGKDVDDNAHFSKKMFNFDERKSPREPNASPETGRLRTESHRWYCLSGEYSHVTQSRSIFSHEDSFVYGNPKEDIKNIENHPLTGDVIGETSKFEVGVSNVLDLSCKAGKMEEEKSLGGNESNTYQNYQRSNQIISESSYPRSNVEIKLISKKPPIPVQLQLAKIQQQHRRSMQQQHKFILQMRRSLDPKSSNRQQQQQQQPQQQQEPSHGSHKNVKYYGNSTTNHELNDLDNHARIKDELHAPVPGSHFPQLSYPYFDPNHPKELPDNHPILPLLDPVYFSALYNAHGFLPPSSPSIAAAFIGTLQDALPKLPLMFPPTSSTNTPLLPQKSNENLN